MTLPFRLLHCVPDLDPRSGGTVAALEGLALAQRDLGWQVAIITTVQAKADRRVSDRLNAKGVPVMEVPLVSRVASIPRLRLVLRSTVPQYNFLHVHAVWEEIQHQACVAARRYAVPYVLSPHGMLDPWSLAQGRLKKRVYLAARLRRHLNRAAAVHCTTATEARLLEPLGLQAEKVVVPNGIDLSEFSSASAESSAEQFLRQFPEAAGKSVVLFLSRLHPKKGLDLLLPAFARCANADTVLVVAGPGDVNYLNHLHHEVARLNLQGRVIFTGMLHGPARVAALRAADLYVLPSYQENFGISVVESLAAGTPVIISDQVNLAEAIAGQGVGEVVKTDIDQLANVMQRWLADAALCSEAGRRGMSFAAQFGFEAVARQWEQVLAGQDNAVGC